MTNKNFLTEDSEGSGALILGTTVTLFSLCYEPKLIDFNDDVLRLSKPNKAHYDSKFIGRATKIQRKYN